MDLKGKRIEFLENVFYGDLIEFDPNRVSDFSSGGIEYKGELNDGMDEKQFEELSNHLNEIGFVTGGKIVIPKGTIVEVTFDNHGNDVDIQINADLNINIFNGFIFDDSRKEHDVEQFYAKLL